MKGRQPEGRWVLNKLMRTLLWGIGLVIVAYVVSQGSLVRPGTTKTLAYNEFSNMVSTGEVATAKLERTVATGQLKGGGDYRADLPQDPITLGQLWKLLLAKNVKITYPQPLISETAQNTIVTILVPLVAIANPLGPLLATGAEHRQPGPLLRPQPRRSG